RHFAGTTCLLRAVCVREAKIRTETKAEILAVEHEGLHLPVEQFPFEIAGQCTLAHPGDPRQPDDVALVAIRDGAVSGRHLTLGGRNTRALREAVAVGPPIQFFRLEDEAPAHD